MTLSIQNHIINAKIQDINLNYSWNHWNEEQAEANLDEDIITCLSALSQRAILAFMCGSAEWIVYRFANLCNDTAPQDFIEAAWAKTIHTRYSGYGSTNWQIYTGEAWVDPVQGPLRRALDRVEIAMQQMAWQYEDPISRVGVLEALISYVMPNPAPYKQWCQQVLSRLESLYCRNPDDALGDVVPREAVDPTYNFDVNQTENLINDFLKRLNYHKNKFMSPPNAMIEPPDEDDEDDSFVGTPYLFDIETDRQARRIQ